MTNLSPSSIHSFLAECDVQLHVVEEISNYGYQAKDDDDDGMTDWELYIGTL